jgi:hypothetical protein
LRRRGFIGGGSAPFWTRRLWRGMARSHGGAGGGGPGPWRPAAPLELRYDGDDDHHQHQPAATSSPHYSESGAVQLSSHSEDRRDARFDPRRPYRDPAKPELQLNVEDIDWDEDLTVWLEREEKSRARQLAEQDAKRARKLQVLQVQGGGGLTPRKLQALSSARLETRWVLEYHAKDSQGRSYMSHMEEPWSMCVRMWEEGLHIAHEVSRDRSKLYIMVAAPLEELRKEAQLIKLNMRMRDTKGMTPYNPSLIDEYVETPNGTEFNSAQEQLLVMSRINRAMLISLEARQVMPTRHKLLNRLRERIDSDKAERRLKLKAS